MGSGFDSIFGLWRIRSIPMCSLIFGSISPRKHVLQTDSVVNTVDDYIFYKSDCNIVVRYMAGGQTM